MVRLLNNNTKWVLFLASNGEPEHRFLFDLAFGVYCLESRGISSDDIFIYVDGVDRNVISNLISTGTVHPYNIRSTSDFFLDSAVNTHENLVMFITGHGSIYGIDAVDPIKPYNLLDTIKNTPVLSRAIIYLGQCYAGVFNYIGAGRRVHNAERARNNPDVILIGATNLHESLSLSTTEELLAGNNITWFANIFLLHVFKWMSNPVDIDGDTHLTIMDSYKYAGALSNSANKGFKVGTFFNSIKFHGEYIAALEVQTNSPSPQAALELKAAETKYVNELGLHLVHQECWILNSIPSQSIEL